MNLSEFFLNVALSSLIMLIALSFISSISFHSNHLEQKIILEDTALRALLTLDQAISKSGLSYCAPMNKIRNNTEDLNSKGHYQWAKSELTIYQKTPANYLLNEELSATQKKITLPDNIPVPDQWLILDDCDHAILSHINSSTEHTLTLSQNLGIDLHPPIMVGTVHVITFKVDPSGLRRNTSSDGNALIYSNIQHININKNILSIDAHSENNDVHFQKNL